MLPPAKPDGAPRAAADALRGRVVLVTGATGGLGRATSLAAAASGATVVLLGRKVRALEALYDEIEKSGGAQPAVYPMDLAGATPRDHADLIAAIERECGRLDGLVHAAAHFDGLQPFDQQTPEEWFRTQQVNVTAPFQITQAALPLMRKSADAAIVFVLDDPARVGNAFWGGYGIAKHALAGLASIVHEETERSPVRTHALLPGPMRTVLRRAAYYGEDTLMHPEPDFAAAAVTWLLGEEGVPMRGKVLDLR
ncbi:MAG TPA: SDR family NAD(P)-dependent oxidoreductase [Rhodanobacteraceae bacterium]|jgi:NAD(P)-dependent dehydrogenase (short-subunit alcohol dehydrogenase family)|nr:SDR family NAD(P)-dependent oxidoreductase [Rhodanobacteraceae bacterium]